MEISLYLNFKSLGDFTINTNMVQDRRSQPVVTTYKTIHRYINKKNMNTRKYVTREYRTTIRKARLFSINTRIYLLVFNKKNYY